MQTGILCRCTLNAKCNPGAQIRCSVHCEWTQRNNVHLQCTMSEHAPVHSSHAVYNARAQYIRGVICLWSQRCNVQVPFTLYLQAPLHIARSLYAVIEPNNVHSECIGEYTYRVHYKFNHRGTEFLMHIVSGHIRAIGAYVDYTTCEICAMAVSLPAGRTGSRHRWSPLRCLHARRWYNRHWRHKVPTGTGGIFGERAIHIRHEMVIEPPTRAPLVSK